MYTTIKIHGQIYSSSTIARCFSDYDSKEDGRFNSLLLNYKTKGLAVKAIKSAYKKLKELDGEDKNLHLYRDLKNVPQYLTYDASRAELLPTY